MRLCLGVATYNNSQTQLKSLFASLNQSYDYALKSSETNRQLVLQIFAIDNGIDCFQESLSDFELVAGVTTETFKSQGNIGFGRAMNILMKQAFQSGDYFICVNPDGQFHKKCLTELISAIRKNPDALLEARQFPEEHPKHYSPQTGDTLWATGACMVIPKALFEATGGFDENLFLYGEDVDLSWQARCKGFKVKVVHDALFIHSTLGRSWSKEAKKHFFLSYVYLAAKWSSEDFQPLYEKEFLSRFDTRGNRELMQKTIELGRKAQDQINCRDRFVPEFDASRMLSPARWGY